MVTPLVEAQYLVSQYMGHTACSFYRSKAITNCIAEKSPQIRVIESDAMIRDYHFLKYATSYRCQRLCFPKVLNWYEGELREIANTNGFPLILDYDDVMSKDDCPIYNCARSSLAMCSDDILYRYMKASDYVTVTTDFLKKYYMNRLNLPESKFKVIVQNGGLLIFIMRKTLVEDLINSIKSLLL